MGTPKNNKTPFTVTKKEFLFWLNLDAISACPQAIVYVEKCKSPKTAWLNCKRADWTMWLIGQISGRSPDYLPEMVREEVWKAVDKLGNNNSKLLSDLRCGIVLWEECTTAQRAAVYKAAQIIRKTIPWPVMEAVLKTTIETT